MTILFKILDWNFWNFGNIAMLAPPIQIPKMKDWTLLASSRCSLRNWECMWVHVKTYSCKIQNLPRSQKLRNWTPRFLQPASKSSISHILVRWTGLVVNSSILERGWLSWDGLEHDIWNQTAYQSFLILLWNFIQNLGGIVEEDWIVSWNFLLWDLIWMSLLSLCLLWWCLLLNLFTPSIHPKI